MESNSDVSIAPKSYPPAILGWTVWGTGALLYAIGFYMRTAPEDSDVVTGVVVTGIMLGPAIVQPLTGWLVDVYWQGTIEAGIRIYDAATF